MRSTFSPHAIGNMSIGLQGKCGGMVAEIALNCFDVIACVETGNGIAMAQIVHTFVTAADGLNPAFEIAIDSLRAKISTVLSGE